MKIALVGPYPPPYGGISVHIQRMEALLAAQGHTPIVFKGMSAKRWLFSAWRKWFDFDVVHFHNIPWKNRVLMGLMGLFGLKVVLTIHGDSLNDQLADAGWIRKQLLSFAMRHISHIIVVKAEIRDLLLSLGVKQSKISAINAYLPPVIDKAANIPDDIRAFINSHNPLLVANGFGITPLLEASDLYGAELTIDLCVRLLEDFPRLGFMFFLARVGDQKRYERLVTKVNEKDLGEHYVFIIGQEFSPVLSRATVFIRPTFRDGYGISVAEALYLGVPAVASDVCERASGAILFRSGDLNSLYTKVREVLDHYDAAKRFVEDHQPPSTFDRLLSVYHTVAGG